MYTGGRSSWDGVEKKLSAFSLHAGGASQVSHLHGAGGLFSLHARGHFPAPSRKQQRERERERERERVCVCVCGRPKPCGCLSLTRRRETCGKGHIFRAAPPVIDPYESLGKGEGGVWGGGGKPFSRKVSLPFPNFSPHPIIPITAPVMQEARRPPMAARRPRERISCRRSGAMLPMPPSMIPTLPGLAKPQRA